MKIPSDITYWKWLVIALHNAVQGCMVISLTHTDQVGAINKKDATTWRVAFETDGPFPSHERLLRFLELYDKIKEPGMLVQTDAHFLPNNNQDRAMEKLNDIRNEFIHFTPKGWSLDAY